MADEQIDRLSIVVSAKGARSAATNLDSLAKVLGSLEGVLPAVSANLIGLQAALNNSAGSISGYVANVKSALSGVVNEIESETSKMSEAMSKGMGEADTTSSSDKIDDVSQKMEEMSTNVEEAGKSWEYLNNPIAIVQSRIERLNGQVGELKQKWNDSSDIQEQERLQKKIEDTTMAINRQEKQLEKMRESANASTPAKEQPQPTGFDSKGITTLISRLGLLGNASAKIISKISGVGSAVSGMSTAVSASVGAIGIAVGIFKVMAKAVEKTHKVMNAFGKALLKVADSAKKFIQSKIQEFTAPFEKLFDRIFRVALNRFLRFALNQITQSFNEGMQNVAKGMESANAVLSQYSTRLMYLKNTLGTMLIPILKALYPLFINVTNVIIRASNAINQFISLLNGSNSWIKAKEVYVDYADSVDSSSKKAKKSVDRLTASFDELHDLTPSSTGTEDEEDMSAYFTDVGIEANISDFYKRLRAGFEKGDLSDVGVLVADKINRAFRNLDNRINWNNVGDKIARKVTALATFLISVVRKIDFAQIGRTFADGLNTIFNALNTFAEKLLDANFYYDLGQKIGQMLTTMLTTINWSGIGKFLLDKLIAVMDFANGFLTYLLDKSTVRNAEGIYLTNIELIVARIFNGFAEALGDGQRAAVIGDVAGKLIITVFTLGASIFEQSSFWTALANAINAVINRISNNRDKISSSLRRFVKSASNLIVFLIENVDIQEFINTISSIIDDILNDPEMMNAIKNASRAWGQVAGAWFSVELRLKFIEIAAYINDFFGAVQGFFSTGFVVASKSAPKKATVSRKGFATGGFPEDGLFLANHNELVGTFSNGKSAVANNAEITQGIYKAVRDAMADAGTSSSGGGSDIYLDSTKVGKAVAKGVFKEGKRAGYTLRTT